MFQKIAKHRANDASNDVHRPPLAGGGWWEEKTHGGRQWCGTQHNAMRRPPALMLLVPQKVKGENMKYHGQN